MLQREPRPLVGVKTLSGFFVFVTASMNGARISTQSPASRDIRIALGVAVGLLFLWATIQVDFVVFAGVLLAIFLRGLSDLVAHYLRLGPRWAFALVLVLIACLIAGFGYVFAETILAQVDQLSHQLSAAVQRLSQSVAHWPWGQAILANANPRQLLRSGALGGIFGVASNAISLLGGIVLACFFGIYLAAEPDVYTRGLMKLFPKRLRARVRRILAVVADVLWHWILGRLFSMTVVGAFTTIGLWALGMPLPVALGTLAGTLTFVPYIGAIASSVPSLILALSTDPQLALYVAVLYLAVHIIEGYVLVPLVQRRASELPPATTLAAQLILGTLSGIIGVTFATPLIAAIIPIIRMAYVEPAAGQGRAHAAAAAE